LDTVLAPLEWIVSWIMIAFHSVFSPLFGADDGATWTLSIVGLVVVIRILLIPLFVKQIRSSRGLQLLQPEVQKIQKKYKGKTDQESRQKQSQELMELYRKHGTNPFSSCLPILAQAPIFFALFRVLNGIALNQPKGVLTDDLVDSARQAEFFGAPISVTFLNTFSDATPDAVAIRIVTVVLIVLMSASTFTTQRQLMRKNMPETALQGPFAQQQKIMLYLFPLIFAVSGVSFPIGVLLYWLTTNLWSMGQQFYVIRRMPAPGSQAEKDLEARRARRGKGGATGGSAAGPAGAALPGEAGAEGTVAPAAPRQRQQPKRQPRGKRTTASRPASGSPSTPKRARPPGGSGAETSS
jgi:YidC/Oxa1 family membrane protein insertase